MGIDNSFNREIQLGNLKLVRCKSELTRLPEGKLLINTINAFSYNNARKDNRFAEALVCGDVLIPDGMSVVKACQWLGNADAPTERVAGWDLFEFEMQRLNDGGASKKVMFFGSSNHVLDLIKKRCKIQYPNLTVVTFSPPYKPIFSEEDNQLMVSTINEACPDLLWIGMTAPKQEKWTYDNWDKLKVNCHVGTIGAVFDFYAGTAKRAPMWWQQHGLEWLYRLIKEPKRMWRRYIIGNVEFIMYILIEKFGQFRK